jgi:hypothetical protein
VPIVTVRGTAQVAVAAIVVDVAVPSVSVVVALAPPGGIGRVTMWDQAVSVVEVWDRELEPVRLRTFDQLVHAARSSDG